MMHEERSNSLDGHGNATRPESSGCLDSALSGQKRKRRAATSRQRHESFICLRMRTVKREHHEPIGEGSIRDPEGRTRGSRIDERQTERHGNRLPTVRGHGRGGMGRNQTDGGGENGKACREKRFIHGDHEVVTWDEVPDDG